MADPKDDLSKIRQKLQDAGTTPLEHQGKEKLGALNPNSPVLAYVQDMKDYLKAAQLEGKNLLDQGVQRDEKVIEAETPLEQDREQ